MPGSLLRRDFLSWSAHGLTATAVLDLLTRQNRLQGAIVPSEAADPPPHLPAKCTRVIHLYMCGGLSHLDSFDYKPTLEKYHGKSLPASEKPETFFGKIGLLRSMAADSANHTPATFQANTGFRLNGFPVLGSWMSYGLGCETDELPAYVVLPDPRGFPAGGTINWSNGFLPARYQGVAFRTKGQPIDDLFPAPPAGSTEKSSNFDQESERETRDFIAALNRHHQETRPENDLIARIKSYELAAKMQMSVPRVTDLSGETATTQSDYGLDQPETADFGRSCLLARRLLEQGVRFVQLFAGGSFGSPRINWDGHENMKENHSQEALRVDQPIAALLRDLRQRGMLDDTLVLFTTEFGRTPFTQSEANVLGAGRDHNMYGFSVWMAGGGLKHGMSYGATDEIGWKAVDNPVTWPDFHATVLHLLGIDHERLKYYHNGIERRLTNVHGEVLRDILG